MKNLPAGSLAPLVIKDPKAVAVALTPRAPALTVVEGLALVVGGAVLGVAFLGASQAALRYFALEAFLYLLVASGGFVGSVLGGLQLLQRVDPEPEAAGSTLPEPGWRSRVAGACYLVTLFDLGFLLAAAGFGPLLAAAGLEVSLPTVVSLVVLGHVVVLLRCTEAGSRAAAHLQSLGSPPFSSGLILGLPPLVLLALAWLRLEVGRGAIPVAALGILMMYAFGAFAAYLVLLVGVRPGSPTHQDLVQVLRKARPGLLERLAADSWRAFLLLTWVLSLVGLASVLGVAWGRDLERAFMPGVVGTLWLAWLGRYLWDLRPVGLLGKRHVAASLEELRRPLLAGSVVCRYCGAAVSPEEAVACAGCETHHHGECWAEFGGCTVYGCGSTRARGLGPA